MPREATGEHRGMIVLSATAGADVRRTNAADESSRYFIGELRLVLDRAERIERNV